MYSGVTFDFNSLNKAPLPPVSYRKVPVVVVVVVVLYLYISFLYKKY